MKKGRVFGLTVVLLALLVVGAQAQTVPPVPDPDPAPAGTELVDVLTWVAFGGGAGLLAFWLIEKIKQPGWTSEATRYIALGITAVAAVAAFGLLVLMGLADAPGDAQGWVQQIFQVGFVAILMSQAVHGRVALRGD